MIATISDILLVAGALGAGIYCLVLSRRLSRFTNLEKGMGGAVAVLSVQVDDLTRALETAQKASLSSVAKLDELNRRAEQSASRLEILLASMHDLPDPAQAGPKSTVTRRRRASRPQEQEAA